MNTQPSSILQPLSPVAQRTIKRLMRDVEAFQLETARNLAFEELRTLQIEPHIIDTMLRQVAQAKTTDALVECLQTFQSVGGLRRSFSKLFGRCF